MSKPNFVRYKRKMPSFLHDFFLQLSISVLLILGKVLVAFIFFLGLVACAFAWTCPRAFRQTHLLARNYPLRSQRSRSR